MLQLTSLMRRKAPGRTAIRTCSRQGFTLVELLVVIAIVCILAAIIVPVTSKVRETGRAAECSSNLRHLAVAGLLWVNDNGGRLPDARAWTYNGSTNDSIYTYQLNNYLSYASERNIDLSAQSTPFKCAVSAQLYPPAVGVHFSRTYSINTYATSTMHDTGSNTVTPRAESNGYPQRLLQVSQPSRLAFFMDGSVRGASEPYTYESNINATHVSETRNPGIRYIHGGAINVAFLDGHVARISQKQMQSDYASSNTSFWRFDR